MDRRTFFAASGALGMASVAGRAEPTAPPAGENSTGKGPEVSYGSAPGPVLAGSPVVSGPSPEATCVLQPVSRFATGYLEFGVGDGPMQRVDAAEAGLMPLAEHVLKFRLPALPPGREIRYRITAHSVGWTPVRQFIHGEIIAGEPETGPVRTFRTLDPAAETTTFAVWNDTHENGETLKALHERTERLRPDFLLWNGDQSNDVHDAKDMAGQFLSPGGMAIADRWPLAYVRGNHDVRGPQARRLAEFTGTPGDRFYYAFRSGPLAALVMDTGEDKLDDSPHFGGMAAFAKMREEQTAWLKESIHEPWFREAPFKVLFCHIPLWFVRDIFPSHRRWEFHPLCREAWLPLLQEAGVRLVVSGHTHDPRWLPAKEGQPLGQLIGGGPQPRAATLIEGRATREKLTLRMTRLDGTVLAEVVL